MPHGHPDWGEAGIVSTIFKVMDLGELAVRLGSVDSFNRAGNVVLLEDFESGLAKWYQYVEGVGSAVQLSGNTAKDGAYSCKLTAGAVVGQTATIIRGMGYPVLSKFGLEMSFALLTTAPQLFVLFDLYDGVYWREAALKYLPSTDVLYYQDSGLVFQVLASGLSLYEQANWWHTLKLVVDFANTEYMRVIVNNQTYSLAGVACMKTAWTSSPYVQVFIRARSEAAAEGICYVDNVILTQNED